LACAISSAAVLAGESFFTASTLGPTAMIATGVSVPGS
jgi:hypothetical protein